jgi:hypothetical protein
MTRDIFYEALLKAYNIAEGRFSGIPDCCIEEFNNGRTWITVMSSLKTKKERQRLTDNWDYVPCEACLKSGNSAQLIKGDSFAGETLLFLMGKMTKKHEKNTDS